jgi:hypothetical protein
MDMAQVVEKLAGIDHRLDALEKGQRQLTALVNQALASQAAGKRATARPPSDGPIPPDKFRLNAQTYGGFSSLEWRLLRSLWGKTAVRIGKVMDRVYGHDHGDKDEAFKALKKRLSRKLLDQGFPGEIVTKGGFLSLDLARPKPGQEEGQPRP